MGEFLSSPKFSLISFNSFLIKVFNLVFELRTFSSSFFSFLRASLSSSNLICSSLLHDYGHFILENPDELVELNIDGQHENIGYEYLKSFFKKEIVEPIKYHVLAKR